MKMPPIDNFENWTPEEIPTGFVAEAGTSKLYETGGWRSMRPIWDQEACTSCLMCWIICPDSSIVVDDAMMVGIDYDHCKGCGVCVHECRFDALQFVREDEIVENEEREIAHAIENAKEV